MRTALALILLCTGLSSQLVHAAQPSFDEAKAFGARPDISNLTLSPNGESVAYVAPGDGPGSRLITINLVGKKTERPVCPRHAPGEPHGQRQGGAGRRPDRHPHPEEQGS